MKKYVFESLKFFCAAILCTILSAFTSPSRANCNLFDPSTAELGDINIANGGISSSVQYRIVSGLIPVTPGETYTASGKMYNTDAGLNNVMIIRAHYDSGQRFIANSRTMSDATFTIPSGVSYVRVEYWTDNNGTAVIAQSQLQFEQGSTATAYTPYNPLCATCDGTVVNYTSATGTGVQNGTPTPDNPIYPTFYTQGNMVLRKVGDYADTYDATTGKITRRVGVKVFNGTEAWTRQQSTYNNKVYYSVLGTLSGAPMSGGNNSELSTVVCNILPHKAGIWYRGEDLENGISGSNGGNGIAVSVVSTYPTVNDWTSYLAQQYAAGTPVTVYYPLATEVVENWTETSYCSAPIKIATTKYNETAFGPLNTALANAISVVDSVVSNTITQAGRIADLQAQKQTRPADDTCPAYKQCLLVEDENGKPHWYEITDPFRDFVTPIIANNVAPASTTNDAGYTQLEYIESTGTQYIDTGIEVKTNYVKIKAKITPLAYNTSSRSWGIQSSTSTCLTAWDKGVQNPDGWLALGSNWYVGKNSSTFFNTQLNVPYEFYFEANEGIVTGNYAGESFNSTYAGTIVNSGNIWLFACNKANRASSIRIHNFEIVTSDTHKKFIPARRNSDGVLGMYDTVSGQFYGNAATSGGDFTAGPTVANTDVPANPTWTATWAANATTGVSAGTITGEGLCNATSGSANTPATSAQMSSANWSDDGAICWCRATGVDDGDGLTASNGAWVFSGPYSSAADCASYCASNCAHYVRNYAAFRSAVFGM